MLDAVRPELGYREQSGKHTKFGEWYADNIAKDPAFKTAPWCDMFVSWAANKAGVRDHVGEFALTTSHAEWFRQQGAWSDTPEPGAVVFFDWSGTKKISHIDHVGVVEKVDGAKVHTIEGNVDGVWLKRKVREKTKIVGYGLPDRVKPKPQVTVTAEPAAGTGFHGGGTTRNMAATQGQPLEGVWLAGDAVLPAGLLFALISTAVTGLRCRAVTASGRHRRAGHGQDAAARPSGPVTGEPASA